MDILTGNIFGFVLVITRVGAFFASSPVFSWEAIPAKTKVTIAILISVFFSSIQKSGHLANDISALEAGLLIGNEALYGLALGFISIFIFSAVKLGASIIETQMGLSMSQILDPLSGENAQPLAILMEMIFILLFLSANGHHLLLISLSKSFEVFPIATTPTIEQLTEGIIVSGSTMLLLGLKLSAPILAAFLLMMVVLAVLARIAPEANILFLSLPVRIGLGMIMVGIFLPFISNFTAEFAKWMDKLLPI